MASNIANIGKVAELRSRVLFTLLVLLIYRLGIFIAVPGTSPDAMAFHMNQTGGGILGLFSMFSGGGLEQLSIFALGVMPYISSSIIVQLLTVVIPALDRLKKEGDAGQRKINQYTRYGTIILGFIQGIGVTGYIAGLNTQSGTAIAASTGFDFYFVSIVTLMTGSLLLMWMGEQIQDRGIGNGTSLIIFAGIVAQIPSSIVQTINMSEMGGGDLSTPKLFIIAAIIVLVVGAVVFFERGQRRIPVRYAKKVVGTRMYGGQNTYLPLKINTAGVIPPIFASSLLMFPAMIAGIFPGSGVQDWLQTHLQPASMLYNIVYVSLIIFFCFFYTAVVFNPIDVADNMKKFGGFIPGIRAGKKTAEYIDRVLSRITMGGALYISVVCILPVFLQTEFGVPFAFGGTSILIVVGVALDTVQQIESHLITHNYEGFGGPGGPRVKGRRARA
ncbi:MAG: preprotein translocase subunit SecY [Deltaproteobacteria bacterium]|nr:preprotein translocase subunit SecY [Deltaproteobacteria bacterium]